MDVMDPRPAHNRLTGGIGAVTLVIAVGALAAAWVPSPRPAAAVDRVKLTSPAHTMPGVSIEFPARFAAPQRKEPPAPRS